ncbi:MAG: PP2C family protein-serine/threonine phosphatase [bacterium]
MNAEEQATETVESVARATTFAEAATRLVAWAQEVTGCEAAMLRLLGPDTGQRWIPAMIHRGLSPRFLQDEALVGSDECMCGRVCLGAGDPRLPFFTEGGSFAWGQVQSIRQEFPPEVLGDVRGRCILEGYDSIAIIPLRGEDGRPAGSLHLADHAADKFPDLISVLEDTCRACGPLIVRHEEREIELVAALEAALLPQGIVSIPGFEFAAAFSSASRVANVGGDFFDVREVGSGDALVLVGDYSGKGMEAAAMASRIRETVSGLVQACPEPGALLREANRVVGGILPAGRYVTLAVCRLARDGRLRAASAGHPRPLWLSPQGDTEEMYLPCNVPVGVREEDSFAAATTVMPSETVLLLYTDGISDARREGLFFGVEGIGEVWRQYKDCRLSEFVESLRRASESFHTEELSPDDRLAVAIRLLD